MMNFFSQVKEWLLFILQYSWLIQVLFVYVITLVSFFIIGKLFGRLERLGESKNRIFESRLIDTSKRPIRVFILLLGFLYSLTIINRVFELPILDMVTSLRQVSFLVLFAWVSIRFISNGEQLIQNPEILKNPFDATSASAIGKLMRLVVIMTCSLFVLQSLGFSVSGVLAFGGIGGIAIGFAAKDLLANLFGGIIIYLDQPFKVGDWVRSPDRDIEGTVEMIGWRLTRIRTFDKRPLYVPNSTFASIAVENPSRMLYRRIKQYIGVRYCDAFKVARLVDEIEAMLRAHPDIAQNQTMIVNVDNFSQSSIDILVYTFTKTTDWIEFHQVKQSVMVAIIEILERNQAEFAFPTRTVHLHNESDEHNHR